MNNLKPQAQQGGTFLGLVIGVYYKYNEWFCKVEIGEWALKWSPPHVFQSEVGSKLTRSSSTVHPKVE